MNARLFSALRELAHWHGAFRWRHASMEKLTAMGLAQQIPGQWGWIITPAGREKLAEMEAQK